MGGILFYQPGATPESLTRPDQRWTPPPAIAAAVADCRRVGDHVLLTDTEVGPDGHCGCVIYPRLVSGKDDQITYYSPTAQHWEQVDEVWIGTSKHTPCLAKDLQRLTGKYVGYDCYSDDDKWTVPVARYFGGYPVTLPHDVHFGDGQQKLIVKERYKALWDRATEIMKYFLGEETPANEFSYRADTAVEALAVNYRFSWHVHEFLRRIGRTVLDSVAVDFYCASLLGLGLIEAIQKKSTTASGPTPPSSTDATNGREAGSPDTAQAGAT